MSGERKNAPRSTLTLAQEDLLRGTNISILLGGIGWRLRGSAGGIGVQSADDEYNKSFEVRKLDIFLSHSWHAWWLIKYLTLLFHFNALPAVVSAMVVGGMIMFIRSLGDITCTDDIYVDCVEESERVIWEFFHVHFWSLPIGGSVFFVVLLHWHYVRDFIEEKSKGQMTSMFLDKVCIHQTDAKRKEDGIKSIGAILKNTSDVLVAWDKTYFERLWCTFELAAFKYANPDARISVVPVMLGGVVAALICMGCFAETCSAVLQHFLMNTAFDVSIGWRKTALYCVFYFPMALLLTNVFREYGIALEEMDKQLSEFSVRQAKCFCCSNAHKIPATGQVLQCDRELVNASIAHWHRTGDETEASLDDHEKGLDNFDKLIRHSLREDISRTLGGLSQMPYAFAVTVGVWDGLAWMDWSASSKGPALARFLISFNATFLLVPMTLAMIVWITRLLVSGGSQAGFCRNRCIEFFLAVFATGVTYLLRRIAAKTLIRLDYLTAIWLLFELISVFVLFFEGAGYFVLHGGTADGKLGKAFGYFGHGQGSSSPESPKQPRASRKKKQSDAKQPLVSNQVVEMQDFTETAQPPPMYANND